MLNLNVSLGDIIVAGSVIGSIFVAYQAMKGKLESFQRELVSLRTDLEKLEDEHAARLARHGRKIDHHSSAIARLDGHVFGRRSSDREHVEG